MIFLSPDESVAAMEGWVAGLSLRRVLFCCLMGKFLVGYFANLPANHPCGEGLVAGKRAGTAATGRHEFRYACIRGSRYEIWQF